MRKVIVLSVLIVLFILLLFILFILKRGYFENLYNFKFIKSSNSSLYSDNKLKKKNDSYQNIVISGDTQYVIISGDNLLIKFLYYLNTRKNKNISYNVSLGSGGYTILDFLKDGVIRLEDIASFWKYYVCLPEERKKMKFYKNVLLNEKDESEWSRKFFNYVKEFCFKIRNYDKKVDDIYLLYDSYICPGYIKLNKNKSIFYLFNPKLLKGYYFSFNDIFYNNLNIDQLKKYIVSRYIQLSFTGGRSIYYKEFIYKSLLPIRYYILLLFGKYFNDNSLFNQIKYLLDNFKNEIIEKDLLLNYENDFLIRPLEGGLISSYDILSSCNGDGLSLNYIKSIYQGKGSINIFNYICNDNK